eukprot:1865047-Rhodomonas_salina.1
MEGCHAAPQAVSATHEASKAPQVSEDQLDLGRALKAIALVCQHRRDEALAAQYRFHTPFSLPSLPNLPSCLLAAWVFEACQRCRIPRDGLLLCPRGWGQHWAVCGDGDGGGRGRGGSGCLCSPLRHLLPPSPLAPGGILLLRRQCCGTAARRHMCVAGVLCGGGAGAVKLPELWRRPCAVAL